MNRTWKLLTTGSLMAALMTSGCAAPKAFGPTNLTTQNLHNVAEPGTKSSWIPKFMQPSAPKPTFGASDKLSTLNASADAPPAKGAKPKKTDPLNMARLHERRGQLEQAIKIYERELPTSSRQAHIHHRLAVIASRGGEWDKARTHYEQAVRLDPRNSEILGDLGYALYLQHQLSDAEATLLAAVEANPQNKSAQNNLGIVLGVQGKYEESLAAFRRAVPDAQAHANLGYVHMQLGDAEKAMGELNQALSLDSSLRTAALALVQLNDLKKRLGPGDLDRTSLAAKKPQVKAPAATRDSTPDAALATNKSTARIDNQPVVISEEPVAKPSVFQQQLAGYMASEPKVRESKPAVQPEAIASLNDSRIKEIPAPLPAPSSFVDLSQLAGRKLPVSSAASSAPRQILETGSQRIDTFTDQAGSVVQASAQVNPFPNKTAPERVVALHDQPAIAYQPVTVFKPSERTQQIREQDRVAREPRKRTSHLDNLLAAKQNGNAIINPNGSLPQSQSLAAGSAAHANADLVSAVQGAQATGAKTTVVNPTTGATPSLVPQVNMPQPEDMLPQQDQMNQLPTHRLHPTASPTWSAPSSSNTTGSGKGPLPRVKVMPN